MLWGEAAIPHHRSSKSPPSLLQIATARAAMVRWGSCKGAPSELQWCAPPSFNGASGELQWCAAGASMVCRGSFNGAPSELQWCAARAACQSCKRRTSPLSSPPPSCKPTVERRRCVSSRPLSDVAVLHTRRRRRRIRVANLPTGGAARMGGSATRRSHGRRCGQ